MENKEFYIQYLNYQPVGLKTHILNTKSFEWIQIISTVGDLIAAYKTAVAPLLDHLSLAQLTLHFTINGEETTYNSWDLLTLLGDNGTTGPNPLVIKSNPQGISIVKVKDAMKVDPSVITLEQATASLIQLIRSDGNKTVFSAQDSLEAVNLEDSILNINITSIDGHPNLLYSEELYVSEKNVGIEMPIDKIVKISHKVIVLIGVSGCGKTRTCYDLCRKYWGLYFDCAVDVDFIAMIDHLTSKAPVIKTEESQIEFENLSNKLIECLIAARLLVLQTLLGDNSGLQCFEWLCIQRSRRTRKLFLKIFNRLSQLPWSVSYSIYSQLKIMFLENGRVIFDESQLLLEHLKSDYCSTKPNRQEISEMRQFRFPRSFFSFLSRFIFQSGFYTLWCGTQMRIRNMEILYSATGVKEDGIFIFTDFNYLEPENISSLLHLWLKIKLQDELHKKISYMLQGRPRFLISFLHKLIESNDVARCFDHYVSNMTTCNDSPSDHSVSSPYFFWKNRIDWTIEPVISSNISSFQRRLVSETLLKLCISFLFGDGSKIVYSPSLDLVATTLVMVKKTSEDWMAWMAEPIVLTAGLRYLADQDPQILMDFFAAQLFTAVGAPHLTPQERGHMMELVISLRFIQGWWLETNLKKQLPAWLNSKNIPKPRGVIDCRTKGSNVSMFVEQLRNEQFPWIILPSTNAGPDLRYSVFCCYVKTTSTPSSKSTMHVSADECRKNIRTMMPSNWYSSEPLVQLECQAEIAKLRFVHLRFELPDTAPSMKSSFKNGECGDDYILCVNLDSKFAALFFGNRFVEQYKAFVNRSLKKSLFKRFDGFFRSWFNK